jgi:hypothetical protein
MNDDDVWGGEMPNLPFRRRHSDPADAPQLDELLDAGRPDANAAPEWQALSDVLRSAAAATEPSELAGEAAVLAAFRRERVGVRHRRPQPIARCKSMFSTLLTGRLAVGLAAGVVTITGAATAAYACVLPSPIQSFAHSTIGAPKPSVSKVAAIRAVDAVTSHHDIDPSVSPSVTPSPSVTVSPSTSASAKADEDKSKVLAADPSEAAAVEALLVYRSCLNFTAAIRAGKTLDGKDLAVLVKAAGSTSAIAAYCGALPVPPNGCLAAPLTTASPTATPSPALDPKNLKGYWWRWCGICPSSSATPSVSPTATATSDADGDNDGSGIPGHVPWFWCGDRGPQGSHTADPSHTVKPLPKISPKSTAAFSDNGFSGFGFGKGSGQQDH